MLEAIGWFFNVVLINPLTNLFVLLTAATGNAGIAVILLTILIRFVTLPLTLKQMHTTRMMAAIGPRIQELNKKYKDPRRRQEEQMKLYREVGLNPLGCFSGMIVQLPILAALYRTFSTAVGDSPEALIKLSDKLYPWAYLRESLPLPSNFLWLHLGRPDPTLLLPLLVGVSTYVWQKMQAMPTMDEKQRAQASMMNMLMPFIFAWITFTLPSGLGLYYVLSNLIGMVMQYIYVGGGAFNWRALVGLSQDPVLPRALEVRQAHMAAISRVSRDSGEEDEATGEEPDAKGARRSPSPKGPAPAHSTNGTSAADRRRRYASGRRRGRR